jgi:hypothetical protein
MVHAQNQSLGSGTKRCRNVGFKAACTITYRRRSRTCDGAPREIRAAKTILHVSGGPARYRSLAVAFSGWFHCGRRGGFLSLGSVQSHFGKMATWSGLDRERRGPRGWVPHPDRRAPGGPIVPGDRVFMVSRAFLGFARCQTGDFRDDYCGRCTRVTRARSFLLRWPFVRTPRNCDSTLIAPARILTSRGSSAQGVGTNRKWYSESPLEWYPRNILFRDVVVDLIPDSRVPERAARADLLLREKRSFEHLKSPEASLSGWNFYT